MSSSNQNKNMEIMKMSARYRRGDKRGEVIHRLALACDKGDDSKPRFATVDSEEQLLDSDLDTKPYVK